MLAGKEGRFWDMRSKPPVAAWLGGEHRLVLHAHGRQRLLGSVAPAVLPLWESRGHSHLHVHLALQQA